MKTYKRIIAICGFIIFFGNGCIPSLHPLYTIKDLMLNNAILGSWIQNEGNKDESIWNIKKYISPQEQNGPKFLYSKNNIDDKLYLLQHIQHNDTIEFELYLLKLGENYYFDFYPKEYKIRNEMADMHLFPVHTFAKINIDSETLSIRMFDVDFLKKLIEQNKIKIAHEKPNNMLILTSSTEELQKFVLKYGNNEDTFIDADILKRRI